MLYSQTLISNNLKMIEQLTSERKIIRPAYKAVDKDGKLKPHRRDIGLGPYPEVSLAEARVKATELRSQIRNGIDPIAQKQAQLEKLHIQKLRDRSFRECAEVVITNKTRELKNQKHIEFSSVVLIHVIENFFF